MLFVTLPFLVFFLILYPVYWIVPARFRFPVLLVSGFIFYGMSSIPFTLHLVLVVALNYAVIELWRVRPKRWMFYALQIANVLNIAFFKYYYFLYDAAGRIFSVEVWLNPALRLADRFAGHEVLLPLGISFYTFQIMSYGFDVFRGRYRERHSFVQVLMYALFFPVLIAGPIMRAEELLSQIKTMGDRPLPDRENYRRAIWLIMSGLVKKVLLADRLAPALAPFLSGNPDLIGVPATWFYALATLSMLYLDFSAYTDLARGMGLLLGFELPINFRAPFFMVSLSDFWRRWHLSFSRWIRDYIYIPLGGSRVPEIQVYLNLVVTFFLGGLWHGASYNFVIWGIIMGVWLSIERFAFRNNWNEWPASWPARGIRLTVSWVVLLTLAVFFFAPDLPKALALLGRMYSPGAGGGTSKITDGPLITLGVLGAFFFQWIEKRLDERPHFFLKLRRHESWLLPAGIVLGIALMIQYSGAGRDFFYFQF